MVSQFLIMLSTVGAGVIGDNVHISLFESQALKGGWLKVFKKEENEHEVLRTGTKSVRTCTSSCNASSCIASNISEFNCDFRKWGKLRKNGRFGQKLPIAAVAVPGHTK